jgi:RNA polymerase sigma-70 factor (ECF subfamily)
VQEEAFIEKLEEHRNEFYAYVYRQLWNKSLVEDVFSQGVLTAWEKRNTFREGTNFRAWVYRILTFKCFNLNKRESKNIIHIEDMGENFDLEDQSSTPLQHDIEHWLQECDDEIPKALEQLSDKERACFLMRSMEELSYKEISEATQLPMGTVMTHLHRARKKMQERLQAYAQENGWTSEATQTTKKSNPKKELS